MYSLGAVGMVIAVFITIVDSDYTGFGYILSISCTVVGTVMGFVAAVTVTMTGMPALVGT